VSLPAGIWQRLRESVDPASLRPRLAAATEVKPLDGYTMTSNPARNLHYRLTEEEASMLPLMDGSRTVKEIVVSRLEGSGGLDVAAVADLVLELRTGSFLDPPFTDVYASLRRAMGRDRGGRFRRTLRTQQIEWRGADRVVRWLYRHGVRGAFTLPAQVVLAAAAVAGAVAFVDVARSGRFSLSGRSIALEGVILLLLNLFLILAHELGHASVLVHLGRRIGGAGFMVYYGAPAFYVDSSEALMLERRQRIMQSFAGPYVELVLAGAASLTVLFAPGAAVSSLLYRFAVLNYFAIFLNLVPLLELDGYWMLADVVRIPDLRTRSLSFLRYDLVRKLRDRQRPTRRELAFAAYGVLVVLFAIMSYYLALFFWRRVFGVLAVRMWRSGGASRVFLVVLGVALGAPLVRELVAAIVAVVRRLGVVVEAARFRLERRWRVEAAKLIDALPLFDGLPAEHLDELAGTVRLRRLGAGRAAVRQGEKASSFFVIRSGAFEVVEEDVEHGRERVLGTLGRGDSFGELGLVDGAPRAVTVRAAADAQLFEVHKSVFDRLLADRIRVPDFAPTLAAAVELRAISCFHGLESGEIGSLLQHGRWTEFPPGAEIVRQGEPGDAFYAIGSGRAEVLVDGETARALGPGSYFGEAALLQNAPRSATVRARTRLRVFRVDREGFERLIARAFERGTLRPNASRTMRH
jgi:putative peptide zinc metalloprotease protein